MEAAGTTSRVFFSYASEDADLVDAVYKTVVEHFPSMAPWMDKYEIVAGDQLLDKIGEGIRSANKFLVFLSARSIDKPWVRAELTEALTMELGGRPGFVIPVKLGRIDTFPPFIQSKRYIDLLELTETEWLAQIRAAVWGMPIEPGASRGNLLVEVARDSTDSSAVFIGFEPQYWAVDISFIVRTKVPILEQRNQWPGRTGTAAMTEIELSESHAYGIKITSERLVPPHVFVIWLRFERGTDPVAAIESVGPWDGAGGTVHMGASVFL